MASHYGVKFDRVLRALRVECPVREPVKVVTKSLKAQRMCGCCLTYKTANGKISGFRIEIDNELSWLTAVDSLLHEWAHAMDQSKNGTFSEPHRDSWGRCYARVWRCYINALAD